MKMSQNRPFPYYWYRLISSYNMTPESDMKVTRIENDCQTMKIFLFDKRTLFVSALRSCMENRTENIQTDQE